MELTMFLKGKPVCAKALTLAIGFAAIAGGTGLSQAATLPDSTAIPVLFTRTVNAAKAKPGDTVAAKTLQIVVLPDGQTIPAGTLVVGHVVKSNPFTFDDTDYAIQKPSVLSIHFDKLVEKGTEIPVILEVRAISNFTDTNEASTPHYLDETDREGERVLVGGDRFYPLTKPVTNRDGDVVGYNRKQGVFARLIANDAVDRYATFHCNGTATEQSTAIFSASACGIYGYDTVYMSENGDKSGGTFTLENRHQTVKLNAQSAALLQVIEPQP
jgi:hypothetical protein